METHHKKEKRTRVWKTSCQSVSLSVSPDVPEQESRGTPSTACFLEKPLPQPGDPHRLQERLLAGLRVSVREDRLSGGRWLLRFQLPMCSVV